MATRISVDPEDVRAKGNDIRNNKAKEYETAFKDMYTAVDNLANNWQGKDLTKMYTLMVDYGDYLVKAADTYQEAQDAIEAEAKKLQN